MVAGAQKSESLGVGRVFVAVALSAAALGGCFGRNLIAERQSRGGDPAVGDAAGDPTNPWSDPTPTSRLLRVSGPQSIMTRACAGPYLFESQTLAGVPAVVATDLAVNLTPVAGGRFFTTAACTVETTALTIASGTSQRPVWLKDDVVAPLTVTGTATGHLTVGLPVLVDEPFWHAMAPIDKPSPRLAMAAVYHPNRGTMIIYGGTDLTLVHDDMWEYDGSNWNQLCDGCAPGPLIGGALTYDPSADRLLLFGGATVFAEPPTAATNGFWQWTAADGWTTLSSVGAPSARSFAASERDPGRSVWVLFGGFLAGGTETDEVWEWSTSGWVGPLRPVTRPGARGVAAAVFRPDLGEIALYGGTPIDWDDLWTWNGTRWLRSCDACSGVGRGGAMLGWYVPQQALYLVLGYSGATLDVPGTWLFENSAFTQIWPLPPTRDTAAMVYDTVRERLVLFGGNGHGCGGNCDETWEFGYP